jgi:hypothetical protein
MDIIEHQCLKAIDILKFGELRLQYYIAPVDLYFQNQ